jgi:hypothetical protein
MSPAVIDQGRLRRLEVASQQRTQPEPAAFAVPNIIEFVLSDRFLNHGLYPRQAALLKVMFCAPELFTDYDRSVLAEWTAGFTQQDREDGTCGYRGRFGLVADVEARMRWCREHGRSWFREVILVAGRRGSKGVLGAMATTYVLWNVMATIDPQSHYGIPKENSCT